MISVPSFTESKICARDPKELFKAYGKGLGGVFFLSPVFDFVFDPHTPTCFSVAHEAWTVGNKRMQVPLVHRTNLTRFFGSGICVRVVFYSE